MVFLYAILMVLAACVAIPLIYWIFATIFGMNWTAFFVLLVHALVLAGLLYGVNVIEQKHTVIRQEQVQMEIVQQEMTDHVGYITVMDEDEKRYRIQLTQEEYIYLTIGDLVEIQKTNTTIFNFREPETIKYIRKVK